MVRSLASVLAAAAALSLAGCKPKPARLDVNPPSLAFHSPGGAAVLRVTPRSSDGAALELSEPCSFVSSNPTVADARQDGTVRGKATGNAEVRVACGPASAAVPVHVSLPSRLSLDLECEPPGCTLKSQTPLAFKLEGQGASARLKATALDDQGQAVPSEVRFEVADAELQPGARKPGVSVSSDGEVRAVGLGKCLVLAQAGDALARVEVEALLPAVDVVQAPRSMALKPGAESAVAAKAFRRSRKGLIPVMGTRFTYSTSNAAIAKVSDDGMISAVSPGAAEVVVAAETGSPSPAFAQIQVRVSGSAPARRPATGLKPMPAKASLKGKAAPKRRAL